MTVVQVWKLKGGISRAEATKSILECVNILGAKSRRDEDAATFVEEIIRRFDKCASSVNATPTGLKLPLLDELDDDCYTEFKECFHFTVIAETPSNESRLKLYRGHVTEKIKSPIQTTVLYSTLMILARDAREAYNVVAAKYPKFVSEIIIVKELEGPFEAGQILMDIGLRTLSVSDKLITDF